MTGAKWAGSLVATGALAIGSVAANAAPAFWTDWNESGTNIVAGVLNVGGEFVQVTYTGAYSFANTNGGTNYWVPVAPYLSAEVDNGPPDSDIVALSTGGTVTITFSRPVVDPLLALVSWNGNTVDFGMPIEFLSFGRGYWGEGTPQVNAAGTGFFGSGEVHGVLRLPGTFSEITFSHTSEHWHGFSVGVLGIDDGGGNGNGGGPSVPEPGPLALLLLGALGLIPRGLRRQRT